MTNMVTVAVLIEHQRQIIGRYQRLLLDRPIDRDGQQALAVAIDKLMTLENLRFEGIQ